MSEQEKIPLPTELAAKWRERHTHVNLTWDVHDCDHCIAEHYADELEASIAAIPDLKAQAAVLHDRWCKETDEQGFSCFGKATYCNMFIAIHTALQQAAIKGNRE